MGSEVVGVADGMIEAIVGVAGLCELLLGKAVTTFDGADVAIGAVGWL